MASNHPNGSQASESHDSIPPNNHSHNNHRQHHNQQHPHHSNHSNQSNQPNHGKANYYQNQNARPVRKKGNFNEKPVFTCLVCCEDLPSYRHKAIFAIGACNHMICYYCSTKMRVLCEQSECPICRLELSEVGL